MNNNKKDVEYISSALSKLSQEDKIELISFLEKLVSEQASRERSPYSQV